MTSFCFPKKYFKPYKTQRTSLHFQENKMDEPIPFPSPSFCSPTWLLAVAMLWLSSWCAWGAFGLE